MHINNSRLLGYVNRLYFVYSVTLYNIHGHFKLHVEKKTLSCCSFPNKRNVTNNEKMFIASV